MKCDKCNQEMELRKTEYRQRDIREIKVRSIYRCHSCEDYVLVDISYASFNLKTERYDSMLEVEG